MNLEQLIGFAELGEQVRDISHDLRITDADLLGIVPPHQLLEKLTQWMRFRNHLFPPVNRVITHSLAVLSN